MQWNFTASSRHTGSIVVTVNKEKICWACTAIHKILSSMDLDKYEYLTGEDLGYESGVVERPKFEYSPLGEALKERLKKDDKVNKVVKYDNDLMYDSVHNFNKHSVPNLNKIPSIDSKGVKRQLKKENKRKYLY